MQVQCPSCRNVCCDCQGCHLTTTPAGTQCCTRCVVGVTRVENERVQALQMNQPVQQFRPNELLYSNNR